MTKPMPEKPSVDGLEQVWGPVWEQDGTYRFDRDAAGHRDAVWSIDTPPPTASGSLHIGHVFSYTHTDLKARFERMRGKHVFYPMGWDDNGLPTERRVQNYYGVRCDPTLPYDPDFTPPFEGGDGKSSKAADQLPVSRRNFIELCERLTVQDEQQFEELFRTLGLSVDWTQSYRTIDDTSRASAQRAFLRNLERGEAYQADAPTLWDVTFRTAVAQAELEDKEMPGAYHGIAFHRTDGGDDVVIQTTRPELLPACVALVAHPDDERFQDLFGTTVRSPCSTSRSRCSHTTWRRRTRVPASRWSAPSVTPPTSCGGGSCSCRTARSSASTAACARTSPPGSSRRRAGSSTPRWPARPCSRPRRSSSTP